MRTDADNQRNITRYIEAALTAKSRDWHTCELCGKHLPRKGVIHHKKYEGATINDVAIVCLSCNAMPQNKRLA